MGHQSLNNKHLAIAIDVGGTKIKAGLIDLNGELIAVERIPTPHPASPEPIVQKIVKLITNLCDRNTISLQDIDGIGISIAGFITADGVVTATAHLSREWIGYDLKARLLQDLPTEYYFALDTPAPTLGEAYYGAGKGIGHFVYVTVSTGIGAGIIAGGKYFIGGLGWAGGVGHTIIDETSNRVCEGCGNNGCLETFAATQGIIATTQEFLQNNTQSLILSMVNGDVAAITPRVVFEAAQQNDPTALEVWSRVGHVLGIGLTNLVDIVSPTRIVVGGGISQAGDLLLAPVRDVISERGFPPQHRKAEVVQASLGDLSGIYGAAAMVFYDLRINPL
jgi:glucokinase-like ROK family protein